MELERPSTGGPEIAIWLAVVLHPPRGGQRAKRIDEGRARRVQLSEALFFAPIPPFAEGSVIDVIHRVGDTDEGAEPHLRLRQWLLAGAHRASRLGCDPIPPRQVRHDVAD